VQSGTVLVLRQSLGHYQFERIGYFTADAVDSKLQAVFNRIVTLKGRVGEDTEGGEEIEAGAVAARRRERLRVDWIKLLSVSLQPHQ